MSEIIYREYQRSDAEALADIIRKTWDYDSFCSSKAAARMGKVYLYSCLAEQTFTQVALMDNVPVGIIMGQNRAARRRSLRALFDLFAASLSLLRTREGRRVAAFFIGINDLDLALLKESGNDYEGELVFFAVDAACRGKGVGKELFERFLAYRQQEHINSFFLYTDTTCNFPFYEHRDMKRRCEKTVELSLGEVKKENTFFLYEYRE